ncbi:SRPBCC family protein [Salinibacterium hongtaonis]|uniref:Polyketide cyclase n=1 Tax=Homoserinimonas hongtaonis TaxID=2079791 RepID=A0A2U1SY12_9MICO|nr:SRPBCC domain-containing protein [Salinibacterium hongtaonis]PWB96520.1 polyketide cyclase [Salinibacterium hongtaonis]
MPVVSSNKDVEKHSLTFVAEFSAPVERVWQVWQDPRQLERWWGPPSWPATFVRHEFVPGGESRYFMTGPTGERAGGWWRIESVEPPNRFSVIDGFAAEDGEPDPDMPQSRMEVTLEAVAGGTKMTVVGTYATAEEFEKVAAMGMEQGMTLALGQIDELLAAKFA